MARLKVDGYKNIAYDDVKKRYYVTMDYGKDSTGKRIKKSPSFKKLKEAVKALQEFEARKLREELVIPNEQTLRDYLIYWLDVVKKPHIQQTTYYGYEKIINNHLIPHLGDIAIQKLTVKDMNYYFANMAEETDLSKSTLKKHYDLLKSVLTTAVKEEIIRKNIMSNVQSIKPDKKEVEIYTIEQLQQLFACLKGHPLELPVKIAAFLGLRRGEINGLRWENCDLDKREIYIVETRTQAGKEVYSKGTKNDSSQRRLSIPDEIYELLVKERKQQEQNRIIFGESYGKVSVHKDGNSENGDEIFVKADGTLYRPNYLSNEFKKFLAKNKLKPIKFHALRHTCASIANAEGASLFDISKLLGHRDTRTTASIYTHTFDKGNANTVEKVAKGISKEVEIKIK